MSSDESQVNITQTLSSLFEEMLFSPVENENRSNDFSHFLSALKEQSSKSVNDPLDFGTLVKIVDGWRNKLNLTKASEAPCDYCDGNIRNVLFAYSKIHGYFSLIVCIFGSLANALNVAVLTRRDLAAAPINRLLKWLAVADVFVMLEYVPFAVYRYLILPGQREMPYRWAAYLLFHMHFAQIFHTASICLTLSLALWRYVAINCISREDKTDLSVVNLRRDQPGLPEVFDPIAASELTYYTSLVNKVCPVGIGRYSDRNHILCTEKRCSTAILCSFFLPPILCIPTYMVFDIHTVVVLEPSGPMILYHVDSDEEGTLYQINFWVHAVVIKLIPCCILTVISLWLIKEVYNANQHQRKIREYNACPTNNKAVKRQCKADKRTNRTTMMLVAVLLLFLVTELPQGILGLLSGVLGRCFFKRCYDLFGELMDALALLNGAINFVLYCSMSRQFRMTFGQMIWRRPLYKWPPLTGSQSDGQNTAKSSVP